MNIVLTEDEARLLIDALNSEEMRWHDENKERRDDWFYKRQDQIRGLKAHLRIKLSKELAEV